MSNERLELNHHLESFLYEGKKILESPVEPKSINRGFYIRYVNFLLRENYRVPREYFEFYQKLSLGGK